VEREKKKKGGKATSFKPILELTRQRKGEGGGEKGGGERQIFCIAAMKGICCENHPRITHLSFCEKKGKEGLLLFDT